MKLISTCKSHALKGVVKRTRFENVSPLLVVGTDFHKHVRFVHDSFVPKGKGGRSSFSGVVATVFGSTGFLGHAVVNHLGAYGSSLMLPYRGTFDRAQRLKLMGDLGQIMLRDQFTMKKDDDEIRELISYSNCVINLIKTRVPLNHYTMEEVNIEWPERLAKLVAEKNDGTRLIHVTHLNCHQPQAREYSNILRQDFAAEKIIRDIYPSSIIVRSSGMYGFFDNYLCKLIDDRFDQLAHTGAIPALYDAGHSTLIKPVFFSDVAEGIARLVQHPDAPGNTFEFVGKDQFTLHDVVEYMYLALDKKFYDFNTLGPLDRSKATFIQKLFAHTGYKKLGGKLLYTSTELLHYGLEFYFMKRFMPRFYLPRAIDLITRAGSSYSPWLTFDLYKQFHVSDQTTGAPGLRDLGVEPSEFEEKVYEFVIQQTYGLSTLPEKKIPRVKEVTQTSVVV